MKFDVMLERLLKAYGAEANAIERFRIGQQIDALLRNHADAILGLVRAAEEVDREFHQHNTSPVRKFEAQALFALRNALAKLNGGKG